MKIHESITRMMPCQIKRENLEEMLGEKNISSEEVPLLLKSLPWIIGTFYLFMRLANLIDSYIGTQVADPNCEIRFILEFCVSVALEILVFFIEKLKSARGICFIVGCTCSLMDACCYYYTDDFAFMPSSMPIFFGLVASTFLYCQSWISVAIAYSLACIIGIVFYSFFIHFSALSLFCLCIMSAIILYIGVGSAYYLNLFFLKLNEKIRQSEIKIAGTMNQLYNLPIGIFIYKNGKVVDWNKSFAKMAGVSRDSYSRSLFDKMGQLGFGNRVSVFFCVRRGLVVAPRSE